VVHTIDILEEFATSLFRVTTEDPAVIINIFHLLYEINNYYRIDIALQNTVIIYRLANSNIQSV
jgi:hypothetical protein